jgi:hypothetical protein
MSLLGTLRHVALRHELIAIRAKQTRLDLDWLDRVAIGP